MARLANEFDALLVHYSTDYVYAGDKSSVYVESDATQPRSAYGRTKLAGEDLLREHWNRHFIFRTSWVFGAHGVNFLKTMLRMMRDGAPRVVDDQFGAPTSSGLIADVTAHVVSAYLSNPTFDPHKFGTYHLVAGGSTTWHGYARLIAQTANALGTGVIVQPDSIQAIKTGDIPSLAMRPSNSRLDTSKLKESFGFELPNWEEGVRHVVTQLTAL